MPALLIHADKVAQELARLRKEEQRRLLDLLRAARRELYARITGGREIENFDRLSHAHAPAHPGCRSLVVGYLDDWAEAEEKEIAA